MVTAREMVDGPGVELLASAVSCLTTSILSCALVEIDAVEATFVIAVDAFSSQLMTSGHRPPPQAPRLAGASRTDASSLPARSAVAVARLTAPWRLLLVVAGVGASSICATEVSQTAPTMQTSTPSV